MKKLHLITGLIMIVVFVLTGQYLLRILTPFDGVLDGNRMMYRASHVYLLMSASVNVIAGCYYKSLPRSLPALAQKGGSLLLLLSQPVLLLAFIFEPANNIVDRPYTLTGCILLLTGVFLTFTGITHQALLNRKAETEI